MGSHLLLAIARQASGLSQSELAKRMKTSQPTISDLEAGRASLVAKYRKAAAEALDLPEDYFTQDPPLHASDSSPFHHRKLQSVGATKLAQVHARMRMIQLQLEQLLHDAPDKREARGFKPMDPAEYAGGATEIAQLLRLIWGVPSGPIPNLIELAESQGAIVIHYDFAGARIDGVSRYVPTLPPMIFLDLYSPGDRARRTLAHEIGHLLMHVGRVPSPESEEEADAFASELLTPAREIRGDLLMGVNLPRLVALKAKWGVSIQSLIMRARDLDIITESQRRTLFVRLSQRGWRKVEPNAIEPEVPCALRSEIERQRDGGQTAEQVAARLRCKPKEFLETYYPRRHTMRIAE